MNKEKYEIVTTYVIDNQNKLYRTAYYYVQNKETALDMVQNTICKVLEKHQSLRNTAVVAVWVHRILVNECMTYLKKSKHEISTEESEMPPIVYKEKAFEAPEDINQQIRSLPAVMQTVIILYYFQEFSLSEIAQITDTPLSTVKTRLYSALKKLKVAVEREELV